MAERSEVNQEANDKGDNDQNKGATRKPLLLDGFGVGGEGVFSTGCSEVDKKATDKGDMTKQGGNETAEGFDGFCVGGSWAKCP